MKKILFPIVILFILLFLSCESNTTPIVYDKTYKTIESQLKLIHYLIAIRNFEEAQNQINKNLALYPDNFDLLLMQGWLYVQNNKFEEGSELLTNLHDRQKSYIGEKNYNPMVCIGLAKIARLQKDYATAQKELEHVKKTGALLSIYWTEQGFVYYEQNNFTDGEKAFLKGAALDKNNLDAAFYRYICQLHLNKEIDEIKQNWLNITKMDDCGATYYLIHADCLYGLKQIDLCKHVLQEGLDRFPRNLYLNNFYAYVLYEEYVKKPDSDLLSDAIKHIEPCMKNPERVQPEFVDTYIRILEIVKDYATIEEVLKQYYLIFPTSQEIIYWLRKYENF